MKKTLSGKKPTATIFNEAHKIPDQEIDRPLPYGAIINGDLDVLQWLEGNSVVGDINQNKALVNLSTIVSADLLAELKNLMQKAEKKQGFVKINYLLQSWHGKTVAMDIELIPVKTRNADLYQIKFTDNKTGKIKVIKTSSSESRSRRNIQGGSVTELSPIFEKATQEKNILQDGSEVTYKALPQSNEGVSTSYKKSRTLDNELETYKKELHLLNTELVATNDKLKLRNADLKLAKEYAEAIVETIHEPLIVLNEKLRVHTANKAFYDTFFVTPENTEGVLFYKIGGGRWDIGQLKRLLNEGKIAHKTIIEFEVTHIFPDTEERIFLLKAKRLVQDNSKTTMILIAMEDVTNQKKEQNALQNMHQSFRIMAENAPVMIWMADTNKNRIYFNSAWLSFTGRTMEEESYHGWENGIHPEDVKRSLDIYNSAFDKRKGFKKEYRLKRKDGVYRWVLSQGVPLFQEGIFSGYIGSCIDINYRVEQEQQKEEFIAVASHELKTPLTSIKIYSELLHQSMINYEDLELASITAKLESQVDRLTWLIKEMLDVTKITGGALNLEMEYFDMPELISEVIEDIAPMAENHHFVKKLQPMKNIWGDRERIRQVLMNYLSNAIKYSPDAHRVVIRAKTEGTNIIISVKDFGIGISENMKKRIFERFYRASDPENTFPGIGLGLYISSEIIKSHHGKCWFTSSLGKGSEFNFSLPIIANFNTDENHLKLNRVLRK